MRYAILFSGIPDRRHLNGLEFSYRTLVDRFGFECCNIHVLSSDKSLRADDEPENTPARTVWPGDGTPYRMQVTGEGSRQAFVGVLDLLKRKLTQDDLLFINTAGHGGNHGDGRGPYLIAYPHRNHYRVNDFCADLAGLPPHHSLVVLMAQCFSGGFNKPVINASRARKTFIASAASAIRSSHAMPSDRDWDSFQRNWIAALARQDVNGSALSRDADRNGDNRISVREAFDYANDPRFKHPRDTPEFAASPDCAGQMTLWTQTRPL